MIIKFTINQLTKQRVILLVLVMVLSIYLYIYYISITNPAHINDIIGRYEIMSSNSNDNIQPKSCINRMFACEGSFEFSSGHFKYRSNALAYLYRHKSVDWYVQFNSTTAAGMDLYNKSLDCLINFDPLNVAFTQLTGAEVRWNKVKLRKHNATEYKYADPIRLFRYILIYYHLYSLTSRDTSPFFIELGAYDGIWTSNTHSLEVCLNWNGLLIEGNAMVYTRLMDNRPFVNKLLLVPGCKYDNQTVNFSAHMYTSAGIADVVGNSNFVNTVHCGPLSVYLHDLKIKTINYFSLDVEGSEYFVLQTINFTQTNIDILQIETRNRLCKDAHCAKTLQIRQFMMKQGYNLILGYTNADDLYVDPQSKLCVFVLNRIKYIESLNADNLKHFGDRYLYQNYQIVQKMCTLKYGRFDAGEIVEIINTSAVME